MTERGPSPLEHASMDVAPELFAQATNVHATNDASGVEPDRVAGPRGRADGGET